MFKEHVRYTMQTQSIHLRVRGHFVPGQIVPGHILSRDKTSPGQNVPLFDIILLFKKGTYCPRRHIVPVQEGDILSQETYCPGTGYRNFWQHLVTFGNIW